MARTAVITGASQGLGFELARKLAVDGWSLVIDARRRDRLDAATGRLRELVVPPARIEAIAGDITDPDHRRELADAARRLGGLDLVVNNASTLGASPLPALTEIAPDTLGGVFAVNVVAPVALIGALARQLGPGSVIVNVSSDAAVAAYEGWGGYGASKAALDHASRVLAEEHPQWRVLAVDPGDMRTEMHQDAFPGEDISDRPTPDAAAHSLIGLIGSDRPSGRYSLADLTATGTTTGTTTGVEQ